MAGEGALVAASLSFVFSMAAPAMERGGAAADPMPAPAPSGPADRFSFDGKANILEEAHFGIINGKLTAGIPFRDAAAIDGLWAPPFVSSDFRLAVTVLGQKVPTKHYVWWPFKVDREGSVSGIRVKTRTVLAPGRRAGILAIDLRNDTSRPCRVPVEVAVGATLERNEVWEFAAPASRAPTRAAAQGVRLVLETDDLAVAVGAATAAIEWDAEARRGRSVLSLEPGGRAAVHLVFSVGRREEAIADCAELCADPEGAIRWAYEEHLRRLEDLDGKLPRLTSSCAELVRLYDRSLVHLLTNRWDVPEFVLHPYYGTGSVRGGCACSYLWNFGEIWEILPLFDPGADRLHIRRFLEIDLGKHFAFLPVTGKGFGPWYMVNQEKIIGLVYHYVKNTGDAAFLGEGVGGRTVLEHVLANALHGDDPARPVALIDYGDSNSHLELRRGLPYNHVMPDLNGRRHASYLMARRLCEAAGKPDPRLLERAGALKVLLKRELWNPQARWFDFRDARGRKDARYTIQMFKMFAGGVLDAEEESGLLGHLNEREFLSEYGIHSLSKLDVAYDPADIDNGGPGSCTCFPPQIAERLYKAGHPEEADGIFRRILWWGERLPYWGDSLVADRIDYRKDTPLQCTIDGAAVAQCIIFGLFGVDARFDGTIAISPHAPAFAPRLGLRGLRLRGAAIDIEVGDGRFRVKAGGREIEAPLGRTVTVRPDVALDLAPEGAPRFEI